MKKFKPILLLLLVFVAGIAVGVLGTRVAVRHMFANAMKNPAAIREKIEKDLVHKLDLSAEQQAKVHEIFLKSHEEMRALRAEFHPKFQAITERSDAEITALLSEEQKTRFEQYKKDRRPWRSFAPPRPAEQK